MRRRLCCGVLLLGIIAAGCRQSGPVVTYSVDVYDPSRDPAADLAATVDAGKSFWQADSAPSGRRLVLLVSSARCIHRKSQPAVARAIGENFILMKVNYSDENQNEAFFRSIPK